MTFLDGMPSRRLVIGVAALSPIAAFLTGSSVAAPLSPFLGASRIITGNAQLSGDIGDRIERLLADRIADFDRQLGGLAEALARAAGDRNAKIGALDERQTAFALEIAKPWYLGWVGDPSSTILADDAAFATFLDAQSFTRIADVVPRPTYPGRDAGWWTTAPPGVAAPAMPAEVTSWTFAPTSPSAIRSPDPAWRRYAAASFASIADARKAKP